MKMPLYSILIAALCLTTCTKEDSAPLSDQALILAIQSSDRLILVDEGTLSSETVATLESNYPNSFIESVLLAPHLGFQVQMRRTVSVCSGEHFFTYLNFEREELRPERNGRDRDCFNRDRCFRFGWPLTFLMPDGTEIQGAANGIHFGIRQWYANHPNSDERPELQFPVEIYFDPNPFNVTTIEDADQLWRAYESCE